jgi:hypothetical protein
MPDTADPVAAALEQIRADHEAANYFGALADDPVPALLAAVLAALTLGAQWRQAPSLGLTQEECAEQLLSDVGRALLGEEPQ